MIDAHSHIKITQNEEKNIAARAEYMHNMRKNGINESIVTVDPFIEEIKCPADGKHYVKMMNGSKKGEVCCKCTICQRIVYEGKDPFIKYNKYLLQNLSMHKNLHVYPVISVTDSSMQWLIDYYYDMLGKELQGIKAYTGLSAYALDDLKNVRAKVPMLVHAGTYSNQKPSGMLEFIKNYGNYFQIAHLGGLELEALDKLSNYDNTLIDISPASFIFRHYVVENNNGGIFNKDKISSIDDMYALLSTHFNIERIVWGSDVPYSKLESELSALIQSKVFTHEEKKLILSKNIKRIIK